MFLGYVFFSIEFDRNWSENQVKTNLSNLFDSKLNGEQFEILVPTHGSLIKLNFPNNSVGLDGDTIFNIFHQKNIYLRPLTSLEEETDIREIESENKHSTENVEACDIVEVRIEEEEKNIHLETIENQFERDTSTALALSAKEHTMKNFLSEIKTTSLFI